MSDIGRVHQLIIDGSLPHQLWSAKEWGRSRERERERERERKRVFRSVEFLRLSAGLVAARDAF